MTDFTYSDNLVPPLELSWEMKKCSVTDYACPEDFIWEINPSTNMSQGDIFKIKFTDDPDNVTLAHYDDLYTTTHPWGEFRLNTVLLTADASEISWNMIQPNVDFDVFPVRFIFPEMVLANGTVMTTFDYLYTDLQQNEMSIPQAKYKITNKGDEFTIQTEVHVKLSGFFPGETYKVDQVTTVTYNKAWGVLSSYELDFKLDEGEEIAKAELLLEITNEDILIAPFEWIGGIAVLIIAGVINLYRKKRK